MKPLDGVRVVEFAGMGPAPFGAMLLSDYGADVLRIERPEAVSSPPPVETSLLRGRAWIALNLKNDLGHEAALEAIRTADVLIESNRPGVMERLGLGPSECLAVRPSLIYARMTGWGQEGPRASEPGHDINYIAVAGVLGAIGREGQPPSVPLNLIGDYGGGMMLVNGILAALLGRARDGRGQVLDVAMIDSANLMMTAIRGMWLDGQWGGERGTNLLDSGVPYYDVYETADGKYMAVGAVEPKFFESLLAVLGLDPESLPAQADTSGWPRLRDAIRSAFLSRTATEWRARSRGTDSCISPVLDLDEVEHEAQMVARGAFVEVGDRRHPAPAPRFSTVQPVAGVPYPQRLGYDPVLDSWGFTPERIASLHRAGAVPREFESGSGHTHHQDDRGDHE